MPSVPLPLPADVLTDADLPGVWSRLGVPGAIDIHSHFMPGPVLDAVWRYFDRADIEYGRPWPIRYRWDEPRRVQHLRDMGVVRFACLNYAHRPGMAAGLNEWSAEFAATTPGCLSSATFFPEPAVADYVSKAIAGGAVVFKIHLQVGGFDPRDAQLDPVWGLLAETRIPVVVHAGSAPLPGGFTGPGPILEVVDRWQGLRVVIAHCGAPEFAEFLSMARRPQIWLDTTMVLTDFMEADTPFPPELLPDFRALCGDGKVLFGSDYPNIPYPYAHQVDVLARAGLDREQLSAVVWRAPAALLNITLDGLS